VVFDFEKTINGYLYNIFYQRHVPVSYPSLKKRLGYRILIIAVISIVGAVFKSIKKG
jgi:hypothetical protein